MSKSLSEANQYLKKSKAASIQSAASSTAVETGKPTGRYIQRSRKNGQLIQSDAKPGKKPAA